MVISDGDGGDGGEGEKGVFIESTETSLSERGRALRQLTQLKHLTVSVLPLYSHCQGILLLNSLSFPIFNLPSYPLPIVLFPLILLLLKPYTFNPFQSLTLPLHHSYMSLSLSPPTSFTKAL